MFHSPGGATIVFGVFRVVFSTFRLFKLVSTPPKGPYFVLGVP